jgi:hypothetical protein
MDVVPVPAAPLGAADATRRWGVLCDDGDVRWPGMTRVEAEDACPALAGGGPDQWGATLIRVELGVVLSDGAGPYLVDADGVLVLVLDRHSHIADGHLAMGQRDEARARIGLVSDRGAHGAWRWLARADVDVAAMVAVLDQLADADTEEAIVRWQDDRGSAADLPRLP